MVRARTTIPTRTKATDRDEQVDLYEPQVYRMIMMIFTREKNESYRSVNNGKLTNGVSEVEMTVGKVDIEYLFLEKCDGERRVDL